MFFLLHNIYKFIFDLCKMQNKNIMEAGAVKQGKL